MNVECPLTHGPVWRVQLSADERGFSLERSGLERLRAVLHAASEAKHCRALVLAGSAKFFCQGMDLESALSGRAQRRETLGLFVDCLTDLRRCCQTVIAVVEGEATGGGVGLACAADVVLATTHASFQLPELSLGLVPAVVLPVLRERMSLHAVRHLALSGRSVNATRAQELGLVDEVFADRAELDGALKSVLKQALRCRPEAVGLLKTLSSGFQPLDLERATHLGAARTDSLLEDVDVRAGIIGLAEGDAPSWFVRLGREDHA